MGYQWNNCPSKQSMLETDNVTILVGDESFPDKIRVQIDGSYDCALRYEGLTLEIRTY